MNPINAKIERLLEPSYIGKVKTRNRMIKSAAGTHVQYDAITKTLKPEGLTFYETIANGGIGLLMVESPIIHPKGPFSPWMVPFWDDEYIPLERQTVNVIHKHGCPTFIQLYDFGPFNRPPDTRAASNFYYPTKLDMNNSLPKALTTTEIQQDVDIWASAAVRAQKAGFDGVEINASCSHMLATFLSRFWNKRNDQYGRQSLQNRTRIVVEIIQEIKKRCGSDFPVSLLMSGFEMNVFEIGNNEELLTLDEAAELAKIFEQAGADLLHVRSAAIGNHLGGFMPDTYFLFGFPDTGYGQYIDLNKFCPEFITKYEGMGAFIDIASRIKKAVSIPVMTVGGMDPRLLPKVMDNAIRDGKTDFIAINRSLIADPDLPNKLTTGQLSDVRPCTICLTCAPSQEPLRLCRVNAAYTRAGGDTMPEGYQVQPAIRKKKVLVVGGGPAGMEAARVAALRGHQVMLYEKSTRLGGLMPVAAIVKGPHEKILDFVNYLSNQVIKLGVVVKLKEEVNISIVDKIKPDVVIMSTGGMYPTITIPGINNSKVINSESLHGILETSLRFVSPFTLRSLTKFYMPVGRKVVIIGGQIQGVQLAEFLAQRGRQITIVDEDGQENLGKGLPTVVLPRVLAHLRTQGVNILTSVKYCDITNKGLTVITSYGIMKTIKSDSIILALPLHSNTSLADKLKGKIPEVYTIGDCRQPGVIKDAITDANLTARKI